MSKMTLGQRKLPTLGQRSTLPKSYVGPTLSCYLGCNEQPSRATANPVGGKACSSTKGGLLRYIPNTHLIHKVSSLKFAYFQGRLSRHITSPSEKTRPESWPGDYMGKATPVWRLSSSHQMQRAAELSHSKPRRWKSMLIHQGWFTALYTQHLLDSQSLEFEICIFPRGAIPSHSYQKFILTADPPD